MAKKYLNLEEAAEVLGISTEELNKLREKGAVRGFADQSSWKFRAEDVQNYSKSSDSGPQDDASILSDDGEGLGESPSDIRLILDEDLSLDESMADIPSVQSSDDELSANFDVTQIDSGLNAPDGMVGSDETVLTPSDDDIQLLGDDAEAADDSYINLGDEEVDDEGLTLASGSSILLGSEDESGVALDAHDSGISLDAADSGISLESLDSSINIRLDQSTFSLEDDGEIIGAADDSGISLVSDEESSIIGKDGGSGNLEGTVEMSVPDDEDDFSLEDTAFEIEASSGSSEYELGGMEDEDAEDDTSVLLLDDDDESSAGSPTAVGAGDMLSDALESETFDLTDEGDGFDDFGEDSDLMLEETVVGDDDDFDDMELDAFAAVDEDFEFDDAEVGDGGSFTGPVGVGRVPVSQEVELGTVTFVGVLLGSILMAVCGLMMVDLIRGMWSYQQVAPYNSALLDMIKGIFG